jgi:hypothetical protein
MYIIFFIKFKIKNIMTKNEKDEIEESEIMEEIQDEIEDLKNEE